MPVFEYVCDECGDKFEKLQKTSTDEQCSCPACGSVEVKKALSAFSSQKAPEGKCHSGG
jgi:putative FmdB family regulatory protein